MRVYLTSVRRPLEHEPFFETAVGVRSLRGDRALWACVGLGEKGTALAFAAAATWCAEHKHSIVNNDAASERATVLAPEVLSGIFSSALRTVHEPAANDAPRMKTKRKDAA